MERRKIRRISAKQEPNTYVEEYRHAEMHELRYKPRFILINTNFLSSLKVITNIPSIYIVSKPE